MNLSEQNVHFFPSMKNRENLQIITIVIIMITFIRFIQLNLKFNLKIIIIIIIRFIDLIINIIGQGDLLTKENDVPVLFDFI